MDKDKLLKKAYLVCLLCTALFELLEEFGIAKHCPGHERTKQALLDVIKEFKREGISLI